MDNEFRLGQWLIQPSRNRIQGPAREAKIKLKSMAVLLRLAQGDGKVVPKNELLDAVWGSAVVTEDVLTQCIVELRKAFQDSASRPHVIETIRGVGFRLIPSVQPVTETGAGSPPQRIKRIGVALVIVASAIAYWFYLSGRTSSGIAKPSIAVLPFTNLSDDPENQYFGDGLAEELLDRLTKVSGLRVIARTSSFAYRDRRMNVRSIGRQLGVTNILEGSVRKSEQRLRITVQLIDVRSGDHRWSQVFDRKLGDVFEVQDEISEAVVSALLPSLATPTDRPLVAGTLNIGAYDLYLLGRHHLEQELTSRARELFERAIQQDPGFARAYAGLAQASLGFRDTPGSFWLADHDVAGRERAEWAIKKALELNPRLPEAHVALAALHTLNGDVDAEETALRVALDLRPDYVEAIARLASSLLAQGFFREAAATYDQALQLDPLNPRINAAQARLVAQSRGYDAAIAYPLRLLDADMQSPQIYQALIAVSSDFGRYDERVKWGLRLVAMDPERASALAELADAYMELGEFELARLWVARAAAISQPQAFKAQARLTFVSGDHAGFHNHVRLAFERNAPREGDPLNLPQGAVLPLYAISLLHQGDYQQAAEYFERVLSEAPNVPRRPPHIGMYGRALLANCYQRAGDLAKLESVIDRTLEAAAYARGQGIEGYPPLTRELAKAYALIGDHQKALEYQRAAVSQGWRQYYLEAQGTLDTVGRLLEHDERYQRTLEEIRSDLERMRRIVRRNGWDVTPEEFLANI